MKNNVTKATSKGARLISPTRGNIVNFKDLTPMTSMMSNLLAETTLVLTSELEPDGVETPVTIQLQAFREADSGGFILSTPRTNVH